MVFYLKVQSMNYLYDNEFLSYWVYFKKINYLSMCMKLRVFFLFTKESKLKCNIIWLMCFASHNDEGKKVNDMCLVYL